MSKAKEITEKLNEVLEEIGSLKRLNEAILTLTEMANKQGSDDLFTYYTLDNELYSHIPHVHICVPKADKHWKGKPLRSGNPLKTIASVRLNIIDEYSIDNLEFEGIVDPQINSSKYIKTICNWLNKKKLGYPNWVKCLDDYITNNPDFATVEQYKVYIDSLE